MRGKELKKRKNINGRTLKSWRHDLDNKTKLSLRTNEELTVEVRVGIIIDYVVALFVA